MQSAASVTYRFKAYKTHKLVRKNDFQSIRMKVGMQACSIERRDTNGTVYISSSLLVSHGSGLAGGAAGRRAEQLKEVGRLVPQ